MSQTPETMAGSAPAQDANLPQGGVPAAAPGATGAEKPPALGGAPAQEAPLAPLQRATPETGHVPLDPNGDGALYGPTERPSEAVSRGVQPSGRQAPPPNMAQWFPDLVMASKQPGSPPQLQQLLKLLMYHMDPTNGQQG